LGTRGTVEQCAKHIAKEVVLLQTQDRTYWSKIIDEPRYMRRKGQLLPDGMQVSELLQIRMR